MKSQSLLPEKNKKGYFEMSAVEIFTQHAKSKQILPSILNFSKRWNSNMYESTNFIHTNEDLNEALKERVTVCI